MSQLIESFFQCPYCWQNISMLLEPHEQPQTYIEDCEVCCQPISVNYSYSNGQISYINATSIEQ